MENPDEQQVLKPTDDLNCNMENNAFRIPPGNVKCTFITVITEPSADKFNMCSKYANTKGFDLHFIQKILAQSYYFWS
jgi:hypothetical protein